MTSEALSKTQIRIAAVIAAFSGIVAVAGVSVAWYALRTSHKAQQKRLEEERQFKAVNETRRKLIKSGSKASVFETNATITRLYVYPVIGLGGASVREIGIRKSGNPCTTKSAANMSELRHNAFNSSSGGISVTTPSEVVSGGGGGGGIQYDGEWGIFYFSSPEEKVAGVKPLLGTRTCTCSGGTSSALFSCSEKDPSPCHRGEHCSHCCGAVSVAGELRSRLDQIVCQIDYEAGLLILSYSGAAATANEGRKGFGDTSCTLQRASLSIPLDLSSSSRDDTSHSCGDSGNEHKIVNEDSNSNNGCVSKCDADYCGRVLVHPSPTTQNDKFIIRVEEENDSFLIVRHEGQSTADWLSSILGRKDVFLARILGRRPRQQQQCTTTQHNGNSGDKDEESPLLPSLLSLESLTSSRSEIEKMNDDSLTLGSRLLAGGSGHFLRIQRLAPTEDLLDEHHYPCPPTRSNVGKWTASDIHLSQYGNSSSSRKITGYGSNSGGGKSLTDEGNSAYSRSSASSGSRSASVGGLSQSSVERTSPSDLRIVQPSCWLPHIVVTNSSSFDEPVENDSVRRWATLQLGGALPGGIGGVILRNCEEGFSYQNSGSVRVGDPVWVIARKK